MGSRELFELKPPSPRGGGSSALYWLMGMWWQCQYPDPPAHSQPHRAILEKTLISPWWYHQGCGEAQSSAEGKAISSQFLMPVGVVFFSFFFSASSPSPLLITNRYHESASEAAAADNAVLPGRRLELIEAALPQSPAAAADGNKTANVGD